MTQIINILEDTLPKQDEPLVSIVMNCFNGEQYLRQAIESILAQSYQNWEVVFWDNQSTDDSANIFKSYHDSRFHYYYAKKHTILYSARNYALSKCKGELIAFLDVDDWWYPEKLRIQVPMFKDDAVGMSCGNYILVNERKNNNISFIPAYRSLPFGHVLDDLFDEYFVHMSTLVVRKKAFDELEKTFDPRFNIIGDLEILVRLCSKWKLASVQLPIAYYRWHQNNTGYKTDLLISDELDVWFDEIKDNKTNKELTNFFKFENKVKFYSILKLLYRGKKWEALCRRKSLTRRHQVKLIIAMFLPASIIKIWIKRQ
jgi:glycosyltransferase involved in cell wall biosynthesis